MNNHQQVHVYVYVNHTVPRVNLLPSTCHQSPALALLHAENISGNDHIKINVNQRKAIGLETTYLGNDETFRLIYF